MNKNNNNATLINDISRQRRKSLEELSLDLVSERIKSRASKLGLTNFRGVSSDIQQSLKRSLNLNDLQLYKTPSKQARHDQSPPIKLKRCEFCHHVPQKQLNAVKTKCQDCKKFCCKNHSKVYTNSFFLTCFTQ